MEANGKKPDEYLPTDTRAEVETVNWPDGVVLAAFPAFQAITPNGNVNLRTLTVAKAKQLIAAGFPYLRLKKPAAEKPK